MGIYSQTGAFLAIFMLGLILSPWPLGSNRDWAWPIFSLLFILITLAIIIRFRRTITPHTRYGLVAFALLLAWMTFQWLGIPGLTAAPTIDAFLTRSELLKTAGYACVFFLTIQLIQNHGRVLTLAYALVITGVLQALLGSIQQLVFDEPRSRGSFVNPNHFAGYLEMTLCLGIGLMIAEQGSQSSHKFSIGNFLTGPLGRLRILIIVMVIALVMSRSRMGNLAFFASVLIASGVAFYYSRQLARNSAIFLVSILVIDVILIGSYFGVERLGERLAKTSPESSLRIEILDYNQRILKDNLVFGTGPGTYETAFPAYRDAGVPRKAVHAEMDYMELAIELGLLGLIPIAAILLTGLHAQIKLLRPEAHPFERGIAFGCLAGTVSILLHATTDVNLQIPANAMLFIVLLALPVSLLENRARNVTP